MKRLMRNSIWVALILIVLVVSAGIVLAEESAQDDGWKFGAELYLWGASVGGRSSSGSGLDIDIGDILDSLEFAFMGTAGARTGKWWLVADVIYANVEESATIAPGLDASVEITNWIVTPLVGYSIVDTERTDLAILGGARFLYMKADLRVGPSGADDSGSNWDGIIGARGTLDVARKWYLFGYLDVGTGESDLTWQAFGGVGYRFKSLDVVAAYRYVRWEFDDNQALDDLYLQGPGVGIRFGF